jgi:hypothetical protein
MPERQVQRKAKKQLKRGKAPTTAAGEYVREEMHHVRQGKHGARSPEQAIAIGLSKARRAGVPVGQPQTRSKTSKRSRSRTRTQVQKRPHKVSARRSRAISGALKREPRGTASHRALASHGRSVARRRGHASMSRSAKKGARSRSAQARSRSAQKAARTRARRRKR